MPDNNGSTAFQMAEPSQEFNLREFIYKYQVYLPWLALALILALGIAFINIRYSTPIYKVTGSLFINKENRSGNRSDDLQSMFMFSDNVNLKNELEILSPRPLVGRVIRNLGLQLSYINKGNLRSSNIYGASPIQLEIVKLNDSSRPFSFEIDANENHFNFVNSNSEIEYGKPFENSFGIFKLLRVPNQGFNYFSSHIYIIQYSNLQKASAALSQALKIEQTNESATILNISMETENTELGKAVINELMKEYSKMNVEDKREISKITMQFIDERLDTIKNELGTVESGLLNFRERNQVIDLPEQSKLYYNDFAEANKAYAAQEVQMQIVNYLLDYLNNPSNQYRVVPADLGIREPVLLPLISEYNLLVLKRDNFMRTTGPSNPAIALGDANINKLREQIIEALKNVRESYRITIGKMQDQINKFQSSIQKVPSKAKGLLDIERQQKIKQDLYLFLLQKREEAAISAAATVASSRVLEDALASGVPVQPNKRMVYLAALILGILIPVGIFAIIELLNDKVTQKDEIEKQTRAPIIGEVGHAEGEALAVRSGSRSIVAEQFRIMRNNSQFLTNKVEKPVILITSSMSGEGKSFIATNFGAVMALTGKKTVILEFDIRKPKLLQGLQIQSTKGLTNYILGDTRLDEIIHPVKEVDNLFVIGCGPVPPNPSELLLDPQVDHLFTELRKRFDIIVVDTAPAGLVSDSFTLGRFSNATFFIIRQGHTLKRQLRFVQELYEQQKLPNMGLLVNDIKVKGRYRGYYGYGNYGYYGYSEGSGSGYFENGNKRSGKKKLWKTVKGLFG
jgi:tyrosine-protein kinase Etk/Wzc